jgi:hypothetical protein
MVYEIYQTTAEHIIGATDASLQIHTGVDDNLVAEFLGITNTHAHNSLHMAEQLGLLDKDRAGAFKPALPYSIYLSTSKRQHKSAILRLMLEQYVPYKTFKERLLLSGLAPEAASQARAIHHIGAHRDIILSTFIDLGTYANSLISEGAGLYRPSITEVPDYLLILNDVIQNRETAEMAVRKRMGQKTVDWINRDEVLNHLVTAYQRGALAAEDPRAPIVHAGNAVESFLSQLAGHYSTDIRGASGINAKADKLATAGHLTTKHLFMIKYLGHIRNAADHGVDSEISCVWQISASTAVEYVYIAMSAIVDIVAAISEEYLI